MTFGFFDFIVIVILLLSGLIAAYRGFVKESIGLLTWIAAAFAGLYGYKYLSPVFENIFKNQTINNVVSGVLIAIVVLIVLTVINSYINKSVRASVLSGLDRILGFIFGLLRGAIVVFLLYIVGLFVAPVAVVEAEHNNTSPQYIKKTLSYAEEVFPKDVVDSLAKLNDDAKKAYAKVLTEETQKYVEETYNAADRKTLNDLFDAVVASDQENSSNKNTSHPKERTKPTPAKATGTVTKDSETRKNKAKNKTSAQEK